MSLPPISGLPPITGLRDPDDPEWGAPTAQAASTDGAFGFADFLDVINPLQHIPVLSSVYRAVTGDEIGPAARMVGGGLFGGAVGFVAGLVNALVASLTGRDVGEHVMALAKPADLAPLADGGDRHGQATRAYADAQSLVLDDPWARTEDIGV